jgi:hypothetical protein
VDNLAVKNLGSPFKGPKFIEIEVRDIVCYCDIGFFFVLKYIKVIYIFYFLKFIFDISILKTCKK